VLSVNNNLGGLRAQVALAQSNRLLGVSLERLSTGVRINRAEDDSAGVTVRDGFQAQVLGLEEGIRNIQSAHGTITVAEQALNKVTEALQVMRSLAVRAADDNLSDEDRDKIQLQIQQLLKEIDDRAARTEYNGHKLLDGSISDPVPERLGSAKLQSNSILADGGSLVTGTATTGTAARTINAISQGSYQVRLVHSTIDGTIPQASANTYVTGTVGSGPNGDGLPATATLTQTLTDRNGGSHTATITLNQVADGSRSYTYNVSIPAGGIYPAAQSFSGTLAFEADGEIGQLDGNLPGNFRRTVTLPDGTASGQSWTLDFARLRENTRFAVSPASPSSSTATANGSGGPASSAATFGGNLDDTAGSLPTTASVAVVDRLGVSRTLTLNLTQTTAGGTGASNDRWTWTVDAASIAAFGTGTATSASSGVIDFSGAGTTPNAGASGTVTITDAAGVSQDVAVDFSVLTNLTGASAPAGFADGVAGTPTTSVAVTAALNPGGGATTASFSVRDRTNVDVVTNNSVSFTHLGGNQWSYTITPDTASGGAPSSRFTGTGTGLAGTLTLDASGAVAQVNGIAGNTIATTWNSASSEPQGMTFDFSGVALASGIASATSNGSAGNPTASITSAGVLAAGHANSDVVTTPSFSVFDRLAAAHGVSITYTRVSSDATGETWSYRINGLGDQAIWAGVNSGSVSGTLRFNTAGLLTAINGATPAPFAIEVGDGTVDGQAINVDLTTLAVSGAADTAAASQAGGAAGSPTTVVTLRDNLVAGASPDSVPFELFDRTGTDLTATDPTVTTEPLVRFTQVGSSNVWTYAITPPEGSGYSGAGTSLLGEVRFDDAGRLVELDGTPTLTKSVSFSDGTASGHPLQIDFSALGMARPTDLSESATDGGVSSGAGDVDAVIYFSDGSGNTNLSPVSTLYGVDLGARAYSAGGISFTIHQAATLDVGLTSYVKAYTYASGTVRDHALQFVTGANEDQVSRVGIARMDVQALFRLNESFRGSAGYTDLTVDDELKAQDLIGQIDDALTYAGAQNLKIGATSNALTRLLSLQRENHTAISGAFSLINDADVALESTRQARRSILVQSGTAMVAQANSQAQYVLQLLR